MKLFNKYPFLIGEISFNYYDLAKKEELSYFRVAKLLIEKCSECGINGVNFHVGDSEYLHCKYEEDSNQTDQLSFDEYKELAEYCKKLGLVFIITPANIEIVDKLNDVVDVYKISSSDLTNLPLIDYISNKHKPILLSTAASNLREIKSAVKCIEDNSNFKIIIMHSVLSYPTKLEDANLLMIKDLSEQFKDYDVGYSDYTVSDNFMFILTTAYQYGAVVLEKYFTLDKSFEGHEFAMDEEDARIVRLSANVLSKINGYKNKQPLICESFSKRNVRKSIVAKRDIKSGEIIDNSNIDFKRPGVGISPSKVDDIIGKNANRDISKGSLIEYDMLS
ncbi:MAG: N-acetylneuraminate synthase family protein [Clostridia bacterium]|uniref:N-acetylneuraminate synthase n=2 Tax=Methanobrevibacter gottschalkii TaxID=190974 RepID=A0A3N5B632_9EURY|nr:MULTISPECIES: N-acetylneuraminate synthase family protein [Methanobrevibacter]MCQ2911822.1 N-acetylneuraminate synthase family protein [Clostridia bacterium]MCQ2971501.1 N-acetylneuraminate synthase family protein [archaeon]RPF52549.1 N-acetylneuraminate synthase [Methanobrevibacter gottschalkii DSM 11977]SEK34988.1 N-acetylneuraminate synthase [Methanobrevibacter gottschalkii]